MPKPRHSRTPIEVLEDPGLHSEAKAIYSLMALWVFRGNVCRRGLDYFAKSINKSKMTAHRRINDLIARGLVTRGQIGNGERGHYILNHPIYLKKSEGEAAEREEESQKRKRVIRVCAKCKRGRYGLDKTAMCGKCRLMVDVEATARRTARHEAIGYIERDVKERQRATDKIA